MRVLDDNDRGVHHIADGDHDAAQGHDIGSEFHAQEGDKGHQDGDRKHDHGDHRRGDVQQEKSDHQTHNDQFFDQGLSHRADRLFDQLGTIIRDFNFYPLRKGRFDVFQLLFNAFNDLQGVLFITHDHDAPDHVSAAVQVGHSPADVRPQADLRDILHEDRHAPGIRLYDNILNVFNGFDITSHAHHIFRPAEFQESPADFDIAVPDGVNDPADRYVIGQKLVGVDGDLILLSETADTGDLGNAGHGLQLIP